MGSSRAFSLLSEASRAMLDAHCHIHFEAFDGSDAVDECRDAGLSGLIVADYDSERRAHLMELGRRSGVWICCGYHPWAVSKNAGVVEDELDLVESGLRARSWVGVGEFGLDGSERYRSTFDMQKLVAARLLGLARDLNLPVVLHIVAAHDAMLDVLRKEGLPEAGGLCHGFSGTPEEAQRYVELGLAISIGTNALRGNVGRVREVCRAIPRARMTVETDAPSRPPDGVDGPNHPRYLSRVIEAVAGFVDDDPASVARVTETNTRDLFGLGDETL